jgi:uncharacterized membrane protein YfcA
LQGILGLALCLVGAVVLLIQIAIYLWAGYNSVKKFKMDIAGAALTGAIAGFVSGLFSLAINIILLLLNIGNAFGTTNMMGLGGNTTTALLGTAAAGGVTLYVCLCGIVGVFITMVIGAILSAIGGLIAGKA